MGPAATGREQGSYIVARAVPAAGMVQQRARCSPRTTLEAKARAEEAKPVHSTLGPPNAMGAVRVGGGGVAPPHAQEALVRSCSPL